jgi:hypothetical protein
VARLLAALNDSLQQLPLPEKGSLGYEASLGKRIDEGMHRFGAEAADQLLDVEDAGQGDASRRGQTTLTLYCSIPSKGSSRPPTTALACCLDNVSRRDSPSVECC